MMIGSHINHTMISYCENCGLAVWEDNDYYHDESSNKYWHSECLPEDKNIGYE